jgi:hypothetical protein
MSISLDFEDDLRTFADSLPFFHQPSIRSFRSLSSNRIDGGQFSAGYDDSIVALGFACKTFPKSDDYDPNEGLMRCHDRSDVIVDRYST